MYRDRRLYSPGPDLKAQPANTALPMKICLIAAAAVMGLLVIKRTGQVHGAEWHGKLSTALLYTMMTLHLLWSGIPTGLSHLSITLCTLVILYSCVRYTSKNLRLMREKNAG